MASSKIKIDQLSETVMDILDKYGDTARQVIVEESEKIGKEAVKELKSTSPKKKKGKNKGKYAKGWRLKVEKTRLGTSMVVYNANSPQLTHLLEFGHMNRDGTRTEGIPHIAPINDEVQEKFIDAVEKGLQL